VTVIPPGASSDPEHVPQRADLLDRGIATADGILVATDLFRVGERLHPRRLSRQSGRFILPVSVDLTEPSTTGRRSRREAIDRGLARVALPAGCSLERPALSFFALHREDLRGAALAGSLALLWLAVAGIRLDSLRAGLASLAPLALGLAMATPAIWAAAGATDELTLLGLAASLAGALPVAATLARATSGRAAFSSPASAPAYRRVRQLVPGVLVGALGLAALLAVPTLGASPFREVWVTPLYAAAAGGVTALLAAVFFLPPLFQAIRPRPEDRPADLERRSPSAWSAPGPPSLRVRNLTRIYRGGFRALSGASFELGPGIVGLLGPNGAGKTTLLRILVGLLEPTRGAVLYRGEPVSRANLADYRLRLGFLPQEFNAYPGFTGERFLDYWAAARGLPAGAERHREIERLLAAVGLEEHARRKVRDYSGGMRRRIGIAAALLGAPELLIVDEPTTGLDLESRNRFRQILLAAAGERIILLSTHIASDVEAIASRLLVLRQGRLCFDGEAEGLIAAARGRVFETVLQDADLRSFSHRFQITSRVRRLDGIWVRAVARAGSEPEGRLVEPSLEEAYLSTLDLAPSAPALGSRTLRA
jgi:ABC-type multidrug transport system ATPase subunit